MDSSKETTFQHPSHTVSPSTLQSNTIQSNQGHELRREPSYDHMGPPMPARVAVEGLVGEVDSAPQPASPPSRRPTKRIKLLNDQGWTPEDILAIIEGRKEVSKLQYLESRLAISVFSLLRPGGFLAASIVDKAGAFRQFILNTVQDAADSNVLSTHALWLKVGRLCERSKPLRGKKLAELESKEFQWRVLPSKAPVDADAHMPSIPPPTTTSTPTATTASANDVDGTLETRLAAMESLVLDMRHAVDAATERAATANQCAIAATRLAQRRDQHSKALEEQLGHVESELSSLRASLSPHNSRRREKRLRNRLAAAESELEELRKTSSSALESADLLERKLAKERKRRQRLSFKSGKLESSLKQKIEVLTSKLDTALKLSSAGPLSTLEESRGRPFTPRIRMLVLLLVEAGVSQSHIGKVLNGCAKGLLGRELDAVPKRQTVARIVMEGSIIARCTAILEMISDEHGFGLYSDTTGMRNVDVQTTSIGLRGHMVDGKQSPPRACTLSLRNLPDHTGATQASELEGVLFELRELARIPDVMKWLKSAPGIHQDIRDDEFQQLIEHRVSLEHLATTISDHAGDQETMVRILDDFKAEDAVDQAAMDSLRTGNLSEATTMTKQEKQTVKSILHVKCGFHKYMLMSGAAQDTLAKEQRKRGTEVALLPSKTLVRAAVSFDIDDEELEKKMKESGNVRGGGYHLMLVMAMLFKNSDPKRGFGLDWLANMSRKNVHVKLVRCSEVRNGSAEMNAGPVLRYRDVFLEFFQDMAKGRASAQLNVAEQNIVTALNDDATLDELAIMAVLAAMVQRPFLSLVRWKTSLADIQPKLADCSKRLYDWAQMADDELEKGLRAVAQDNADDALTGVSGRPIKSKSVAPATGFPDAVARVTGRKLTTMLKAVFEAMSSKLEGTITPFLPGGQYEFMSDEIKQRLEVVRGTNDVSEGALGRMRQRIRVAPHISIRAMEAEDQFKTSGLVQDMSTTDGFDATVERITPLFPSARARSREILKVPTIARALEIQDRRDERAKEAQLEEDRKAAKRETLKDKRMSVPPVLSIKRVRKLSSDDALKQLQRWKVVLGKSLILSEFKLVDERRKKLVELIESNRDVVEAWKSDSQWLPDVVTMAEEDEEELASGVISGLVEEASTFVESS